MEIVRVEWRCYGSCQSDNNTSASHDLAGVDERLKVASMAVGRDVAFTMLQRCSEWKPKEDLVNLPTAFFTVSPVLPFLIRRRSAVRIDDHFCWCDTLGYAQGG